MAFLAAVAAGLAVSVGFVIQRRVTLGEQADRSYVVSTNQTIRPLGKLVRLEYVRPKDAARSPDASVVAILTHRKVVVLDAGGDVKAEVPASAGPVGIAWAPDGKTLYHSMAGGKVRALGWDGTALQPGEVIDLREVFANKDPQVNGLAVAPDGRTLYVALGIRNEVAVWDLSEKKLRSTVPVGVAPYHLELSADGATLAIANRGGMRIATGDPQQLDPNTGAAFEGTGVPTARSAGTPVRIDARTDAAAAGSVSLIRTADGTVREVAALRQPSGMAFSAEGRTLYVTGSDSDDIGLLDVAAGRLSRTIPLRSKDEPLYGQIPTDVEPLPDGRLLVSLGGLNAVAVVRPDSRRPIEGYIPTGWYPIAVEASGDRFVVACAKGIGSRPANKTTGFGVHDSVGSVQTIPVAELRNLREHSRTVLALNGSGGEERPRRDRKPQPIPERPGEPSPFRHVVYIIKENLTYDSTMGDIREGNGDASLCTFGENVTPNHHALAREFVLLDNFYISGTNSADGHQWVASSIANGYTEQNYSANARSYPYDGGDPLAFSPEGFLWTQAAKAGKSVRVFGEFVDQPRVTNPKTGKTPSWTELWEDYKSGRNEMVIQARTSQAALRPFLHPRYIGFPSIVSDQWRADQFLAELKDWERKGDMPALTMMLLPNDHTVGTAAGFPTPRAAVADNDLALGRVIEGLTNSKFWKDTLIIVAQDDSQLGVDHVDGHRSIAFCVSPYTRRGAVVSERYDHTSIARTVELVLGIPPMNRFDRRGRAMTACLTDRPDLKPYTAKPNTVPLDEMNAPPRRLQGEARRLAEQSAKLDWSDVDRADPETVTRAIWASQKPGIPFPERTYRAGGARTRDE